VSLARRAAADGLGTALLLAVVVGSGVMGERLAGGNVALALLANALATGLGLAALIMAFTERSGAHFNPVVTAVLAWKGRFPASEVVPYIAAQVIGALLGVIAAHAMFELPLLQASAHARLGAAQWWSELVATFGLVFIALSCNARQAPYAIGAYIAAAYWFTASTSFANPAVTLARAFTDTFSGIRIDGVLPFVLAQVSGAACAAWADRYLAPQKTE
jgi:glycerol uptake facilitator-like aquaporin